MKTKSRSFLADIWNQYGSAAILDMLTAFEDEIVQTQIRDKIDRAFALDKRNLLQKCAKDIRGE